MIKIARLVLAEWLQVVVISGGPTFLYPCLLRLSVMPCFNEGEIDEHGYGRDELETRVAIFTNRVI